MHVGTASAVNCAVAEDKQREGTMSMQTPSTASWLTPADRVAAQWGDALLVVARIFIGWIFIRYGWEQLSDLPKFADGLARRGVPGFMAYIAGPIDMLGGIALVLGLGTRYVAPVMLVFTIVATLISHSFWSLPVEQVRNQEAHFWRNVTLLGGLILLFVHGAGRFALDRMLARKG
jgi:putative oxidoreductase